MVRVCGAVDFLSPSAFSLFHNPVPYEHLLCIEAGFCLCVACESCPHQCMPSGNGTTVDGGTSPWA